MLGAVETRDCRTATVSKPKTLLALCIYSPSIITQVIIPLIFIMYAKQEKAISTVRLDTKHIIIYIIFAALYLNSISRTLSTGFIDRQLTD